MEIIRYHTMLRQSIEWFGFKASDGLVGFIDGDALNKLETQPFATHSFTLGMAISRISEITEFFLGDCCLSDSLFAALVILDFSLRMYDTWMKSIKSPISIFGSVSYAQS